MNCLHGKVVSGMGNFGFWIEKLRDFYLMKTGVQLYPGTLNVQLPQPYSLPSELIRLEKEEYGGTVSVSIVPCRFLGRSAFLLRTDANENGTGHHPKTIVEIASDLRLRDYYGLHDDDEVEIEFPN